MPVCSVPDVEMKYGEDEEGKFFWGYILKERSTGGCDITVSCKVMSEGEGLTCCMTRCIEFLPLYIM